MLLIKARLSSLLLWFHLDAQCWTLISIPALLIFPSPGWSGKRGSVRAQKRGIQLHWIRFGGFMSAVISWNSNFSLQPSLISLSEFIVHRFFLFLSSLQGREKRWCMSLNESSDLHPSFLSFFYKSHAAAPPRTTRGLCYSSSVETGGQICGCSMEITLCVFPRGPHRGHLWSRGDRRGGCGNNLPSFSEGSEVACLREFILSASHFNLEHTEARRREMDAAENAK